MHAAHRLFPRLLSLYAYNFLMNCPTKTIFGMKVILVIKKIFTLLQNLRKCGLDRPVWLLWALE